MKNSTALSETKHIHLPNSGIIHQNT